MRSQFKTLFLSISLLVSIPTMAQTEMERSKKKPLFIAHYMTWFGLPEKSGDWYQWRFALKGVDLDKHHYPDLTLSNGNRDIAALHYPKIGPYDSSDPNLVEYHILLAKDAGIEGFMVNWYGFETKEGIRRQEDKGFEQLLKTAEKLDFKVCINLDDKSMFPPYHNFKNRNETIAFVKKTLNRVMEKYGKSPAYLKIEGRPVLSNFGSAYVNSDSMEQKSFSVAEWDAILKSLKKFNPYMIHDHHWDWRKTIEEAGFHKVSESIYSWIGGKENRVNFLKQSQALVKEGKLKIVTGMANPGFDNTPCWGWGGGISKIPRRNGKEYKEQFNESLEYGSSFIHLVTWNDFTEGSTIEPTNEYGSKYLDITADYANRWSSKKHYGKLLDYPKKIFDLRQRHENIEKSRLSTPKALNLINIQIEQAIKFFNNQDSINTNNAIKEAHILLRKEEKRIPKEKPFTATLTPPTIDLYPNEKATLTLKVKNPHKETYPVYIDLDRYGVPRSWMNNLDSIVWLGPKEEKSVKFDISIPKNAKETIGWFTASADSPFKPVKSNVSYLHVYEPFLRINVGPINILRVNKEEKLFLELDSKNRSSRKVGIKINAPKGWIVKLSKNAATILNNGKTKIPFTILIPNKTKTRGMLKVTVTYDKEKVVLQEPMGALLNEQAVLLKGDLNQDGIKDYILGNQNVEVHVTPAIGGRILSLFNRQTGNHQLYLNYPAVQRTEGDTWEKWAEYGGINDWFPGEWPGKVWNNNWDVVEESSNKNQVVLALRSKTPNKLIIERKIVLEAQGSDVMVQYTFKNNHKKEQKVFWTSHPDLAPGGEANNKDFIIIPLEDSTDVDKVEIKQFLPLHKKSHFLPVQNWMLAHDSKSKEYVAQLFDKTQIEKIGVWESMDFFTMELISKEMKIKPGQSQNLNVKYRLGQGELRTVIKTLKTEVQ